MPRFFAPCPRGLETVLAEELREIAARSELPASARFTVEEKPTQAGVVFEGRWLAGCVVNLHSRIASRVLMQVAEGAYQHEDDIYTLASGVMWEKHFGPTHTFRVDVTAQHSPLRSLNFVGLRIKDALCDRLREREGSRPSVDTGRPDIRVFAHLTEHHATIYLDMSGEPLFKRGWRLDKGAAPLKENLAAGLLRLSGWKPNQPLLDPMCGSGTVLIEAAQIALDMPPGIDRHFSFECWRDADRASWESILTQATQALHKRCTGLPRYGDALAGLGIYIAGSDISTAMLEMVRSNWERAGLPGTPSLKQVDARHLTSPFASDLAGVLLSNPPYGERLRTRGQKPGRQAATSLVETDQEDGDAGLSPEAEAEQSARADAFAQAFASSLKKNFAGWTAQIFTGDLEWPRRMRLKPSRRVPLFNGPIECRLFRFEMVMGSARKSS